MRCFKCGHELPKDSLFCQFCGEEVRKTPQCHACGSEVLSDAAFCAVCGASLSPPVQEPSAAEETQKKKKGRALPFVVLGVTIALLCLLVLSVFKLFDGFLMPAFQTDSATISSPAEAAKSVLYLECYDHTGDPFSSGSGFLIEDGKTLVTNYHVIENVYSMTAYDADGLFAAEISAVLWSSETTDLAVLELDRDTGLPPLPLGDSASVGQGDPIYAIGYPLGMSNTLSDGIVSSRFTEDTVDILQITAPISPGSSGGALLDPHGQVIGVVYARYEDGQNMNLAIAANELRDLMKRYSIPVRLEELYHQLPPQLSLSDHGAELRYLWAPDEELACEIQFVWSELETTSLALDVLLEEYDGGEGCIGHDEPVYLLPGVFSEEFDTWCFDTDRRFGDLYLMPEENGYGLYFFCAPMEGPVVETPAEEPAPEQAPAGEPPEEVTVEEVPAEEAPVEGPSAEEPVCTHIWSIWAVGSLPTCTSDGQATACCTLCRAWERRVLPALGHSYQGGSCIICGAKEPIYVPPVQTAPIPEEEVPPAAEESTPPVETPILTQDMLQGTWSTSQLDGIYGRSQRYTFYEHHFYWKFWKGGINGGGEDAIEDKRDGTYTIEGNNIYFSDGTVGTYSNGCLYINGLTFY